MLESVKTPHDISEKSPRLGIMQYAILQLIDSWPDKAYGTAIAAEVSRKIGRDLLEAQIYVALGRLEDRGLLQSHIETKQAPVPGKGRRGRPRKMYALTGLGRGALETVGAFLPTASPSMTEDFA